MVSAQIAFVIIFTIAELLPLFLSLRFLSLCSAFVGLLVLLSFAFAFCGACRFAAGGNGFTVGTFL